MAQGTLPGGGEVNETSALQTAPARELIPGLQEWTTIRQCAEILLKSGFLPTSIKTPEQAVAVILKGREIGIPPMHALSHIVPIQGKPACSSELQLALLARGGVTWEWKTDGTDGKAEIVFRREGFAPVTGSFTLDDAKRAELTNKDSWKKYGANMLRARAISNGARMIGPDLLMGMSYTPEELGAEVNEDETPIQTPAEVVTSKPAPAPSVAWTKLQVWCEGHKIPFPMFANSCLKHMGKEVIQLTTDEARAFCLAFKERHPEYFGGKATAPTPEKADARGITPSMVMEFTELADRAFKADMIDEAKRDELVEWLDKEATKEELESKIANFTALFE